MTTIQLDPDDIGFVPGAFNLNGIESAMGGRFLLSVNSTSGELYRVNPRNGNARTIDLGGASVSAGDGLLKVRRTLYVVRNELNLVAVVRLRPGLLAGRTVNELTARRLDFPDDCGSLRWLAVPGQCPLQHAGYAGYAVLGVAPRSVKAR